MVVGIGKFPKDFGVKLTRDEGIALLRSAYRITHPSAFPSPDIA